MIYGSTVLKAGSAINLTHSGIHSEFCPHKSCILNILNSLIRGILFVLWLQPDPQGLLGMLTLPQPQTLFYNSIWIFFVNNFLFYC